MFEESDTWNWNYQFRLRFRLRKDSVIKLIADLKNDLAEAAPHTSAASGGLS